MCFPAGHVTVGHAALVLGRDLDDLDDAGFAEDLDDGDFVEDFEDFDLDED